MTQTLASKITRAVDISRELGVFLKPVHTTGQFLVTRLTEARTVMVVGDSVTRDYRVTLYGPIVTASGRDHAKRRASLVWQAETLDVIISGEVSATFTGGTAMGTVGGTPFPAELAAELLGPLGLVGAFA